MQWKFIHLPSVYSLTLLLTHSLTHLSAYCSCIPFEACPQVPGLFFIIYYFMIKVVECSAKDTYNINGVFKVAKKNSFSSRLVFFQGSVLQSKKANLFFILFIGTFFVLFKNKHKYFASVSVSCNGFIREAKELFIKYEN